jgi:hypothetical protein
LERPLFFGFGTTKGAKKDIENGGVPSRSPMDDRGVKEFNVFNRLRLNFMF